MYCVTTLIDRTLKYSSNILNIRAQSDLIRIRNVGEAQLSPCIVNPNTAH